MRKISFLAAFFFSLGGLCLLSACAPVTAAPQGTAEEVRAEADYERGESFKQIAAEQIRVEKIAFPLLTANASFCGEYVQPLYGFTVWDLDTVQRGRLRAAKELYALDHSHLSIKTVAAHSPAQRVGIRTGDLLLAINGTPLPEDRSARKTMAKLLGDSGFDGAHLALMRAGKVYNVALKPVAGCAFPISIDTKDTDLNAYADGSSIKITRSMVRFARTDDELAAILGHELGHDVLRHNLKKEGNAAIGRVGGFALDQIITSLGLPTGGEFTSFGSDIGAEAYSVGFEQEADYVGMYFMTRAGYTPKHVEDLWRRMAVENDKSIGARKTHPTSPERFLAIARTEKEIADKQRRHQPLVPNFREQP